MEKMGANALAEFLTNMYPQLGNMYIVDDGATNNAVLYNPQGDQKKLSFAKVIPVQVDVSRKARKAITLANRENPIGDYYFEQSNGNVVFVYTLKLNRLFGYRNREKNLLKVMDKGFVSLNQCTEKCCVGEEG